MRKIEHLQTVQGGLKEPRNNSDPTIAPQYLNKYSSLSIFKKSNELAKPLPTMGPFICDSSIALNKEELAILSKDPKFSIACEPDEMTFKIEYERALAKHRYNEGTKKKEEEHFNHNETGRDQ